MNLSAVEIKLPVWVETFVDRKREFSSDEEKMDLTVRLARENVLQKTGGPFGAAIFDSASGKILSVGVNQVVRLNNSVLHAETVAIMLAQAAIESHSLSEKGNYELFASCEPCCMCLGATLWSGVKRLVCGASKEDATRVGFDEGPVFESSYEYLERRGIEIRRNLLRAEAAEVFDLYLETGGVIYNP
jgi:tRNA(Arg) A34 adenosine deaminase TadA